MREKNLILTLGFWLLASTLFSQNIDRKIYFKHLLKNIDKVEVVCLQNNDTSKQFIKRKDLIKYLTDVITGRQERPKFGTLNKIGYLIYYDKNILKLKVDVLTTGIGYKYKGMYIFSLISYQADMLFKESCNPAAFNIQK